MENSYTYNQITALLYKELNAEDVVETFASINADSTVKQAYSDLRAAKAQLPQVLFEPAPATLQSILDYSARSAA